MNRETNMQFDPSNPPACDLCHAQPATIQFVEQKGAETKKVSMCASCAAARGIAQDGGSLTFNLPSLLAALAAGPAVESAVVCRTCGLSPAEFQKTGRLGCADCYEVFDALIRPIVKKFQAGQAHRGLAPVTLSKEIQNEEAVELRKQLADCVKAEQYEKAAQLRDRLREIDGVPRPKSVLP